MSTPATPADVRALGTQMDAAITVAKVERLGRRAEAALSTTRVAFRCPECGTSWTVLDDPNEWAYGHDCEA